MKHLIQQYQSSVLRFPLANASSILAFLFAVLLIENQPHWANLPIAKCFLVSVLAIPAFVAAQLLEEAHGLRSSKKFLYKFFVAGLLLFYFLWWDGDEVVLAQWLQAGLFFVCFHLLISVGPFINRKQTQCFWQYNRNLLAAANVASFYSLVLCLGTLALIQALIHLFDLTIPWRVSTYTILLFLFVFQTGFQTATLPTSFDAPVQIPRFLRLFVQFVLVPLMAVYFLVISAYTIRLFWIQHHLTLWFAYLILAYIALAIASFAVGWPLQEFPEMRWLRKFFRVMFVSLVPSGLLLGWFVWGRIKEEGFNFERGLWFTLVFWLIPMALYFIFSKAKNIKALPISFGIWCFGISIGPWSIFNISRADELSRLNKLLSEQSLMQAGVWQPAQPQLEDSIRFKIQDKVFRIRQNFGKEALFPLLAPSVADSLRATAEADFEQELFRLMNISSSDESESEHQNAETISSFMFTFKGASLEEGLEVAGYKKIYWFKADWDQADEAFLKDSDVGRINSDNDLEIEIEKELFTVKKEDLVGKLKNTNVNEMQEREPYNGAESLVDTYKAGPRQLRIVGSRQSSILIKLEYLSFSKSADGDKIYLQAVNGYVLK